MTMDPIFIQRSDRKRAPVGAYCTFRRQTRCGGLLIHSSYTTPRDTTLQVSADRAAWQRRSPWTRLCENRVRNRLSAGGRWIRTICTAPRQASLSRAVAPRLENNSDQLVSLFGGSVSWTG